MILLSLDEELAQKLYDGELAKEATRQDQEKYNLEKALELQRQLDKREKDVDKGDQGQEIDWNDPKVLRYHALQNIAFSKADVRKNTYLDFIFNKKDKKQKLDEQTDEEVEAQADSDQEVEEIKLYIRIVPDEDIKTNGIPLATKPLMIVEYKIVKEGKISTYLIVRANGSTNRYTLMIKLLENIDREDLETLWKLVKDKYENTRLKEDYERVL
uniref:Uncharacterized protein n=1 Tax=Tanacetum cinerariifolium TaxID=118510 RepID=A0A6L2NBR5_TANCI|nr:hypothetical protein [Tanacetum cinerariifolium]GEW35306.1 hypothetical protein [Tanacetum cinerariifolium]